ncbi:MAG: chemotaxis protein CheD, partial [Fibrobacterota bacterium]
ALGSCIGVAAFDPVAGFGGLLHYMLPDSHLDENKARENPFMFADSGIRVMLDTLKQAGCDIRRLVVKAAGGSNIMDPNETFNIGKKNYLALKKVLWRYNLLLKGEDVGGSISRNMVLNLATAEVLVKHAGDSREIPL